MKSLTPLSLALALALFAASSVPATRAQAHPMETVVPADGGLSLAAPLAARQQVSIRPLLLIFNEFGFEYERLVAPGITVVGALGLQLPSAWSQGPAADRLDELFGLSMSSVYTTFGLEGEVGARFYPGGQHMSGFFIHPSVAYQFRSSDASQNVARTNEYDVPRVQRITVNARLGYQWLFARRLAVAVDGGLSYKQNHAANTYRGDIDHFQRGAVVDGWHTLGIAPNVHVGVGGWF